MRKFLNFIMITSMFLCGCAGQSGNKAVPVNPADMSHYETYDANTDYVFEVSTVEQFIERFDNDETFTAYFGFDNCPFCNQAMPVLNSVASELNTTVDYIDARANASWKSNTDIDSYDELVKRIGSLFEVDEKGPHMYVPLVVFIKDGEIASSHVGYTDDFDADYVPTKEQHDELVKIYTDGFEKIGITH